MLIEIRCKRMPPLATGYFYLPQLLLRLNESIFAANLFIGTHESSIAPLDIKG